MRMANLAKVDTKIIEDIEMVLKEQLEATGVVEGKQLGGVEVVANIFNQMDRTAEMDLLGKVEELDPDLAERIRQLMFTFEDLAQLDDRGVQVLLKEVSSEDISVALKGRFRPDEGESLHQYVGEGCGHAEGRPRGHGACKGFPTWRRPR